MTSALWMAWMNPGKRPDVHLDAKDDLQNRWPRLYAAVRKQLRTELRIATSTEIRRIREQNTAERSAEIWDQTADDIHTLLKAVDALTGGPR